MNRDLLFNQPLKNLAATIILSPAFLKDNQTLIDNQFVTKLLNQILALPKKESNELATYMRLFPFFPFGMTSGTRTTMDHKLLAAVLNKPELENKINFFQTLYYFYHFTKGAIYEEINQERIVSAMMSLYWGGHHFQSNSHKERTRNSLLQLLHIDLKIAERPIVLHLLMDSFLLSPNYETGLRKLVVILTLLKRVKSKLPFTDLLGRLEYLFENSVDFRRFSTVTLPRTIKAIFPEFPSVVSLATEQVIAYQPTRQNEPKGNQRLGPTQNQPNMKFMSLSSLASLLQGQANLSVFDRALVQDSCFISYEPEKKDANSIPRQKVYLDPSLVASDQKISQVSSRKFQKFSDVVKFVQESSPQRQLEVFSQMLMESEHPLGEEIVNEVLSRNLIESPYPRNTAYNLTNESITRAILSKMMIDAQHLIIDDDEKMISTRFSKIYSERPASFNLNPEGPAKSAAKKREFSTFNKLSSDFSTLNVFSISSRLHSFWFC